MEEGLLVHKSNLPPKVCENISTQIVAKVCWVKVKPQVSKHTPCRIHIYVQTSKCNLEILQHNTFTRL